MLIFKEAKQPWLIFLGINFEPHWSSIFLAAVNTPSGLLLFDVTVHFIGSTLEKRGENRPNRYGVQC